ncbi:hypothetical protein BH11MYX3_BH11MYX3_32500 [soil metagenome]
MKPLVALAVMIAGTAIGVVTYTRCGSQATYLSVVMVSPTLAITEDRSQSHIRLTSHDLTKAGAIIAVRIIRQSHTVPCWSEPPDELACDLGQGDLRVLDPRTLTDRPGRPARHGDHPAYLCTSNPSIKPRAEPPFRGELLQCPDDRGAWLRGSAELGRLDPDGALRWTAQLPAKPDEVFVGGSVVLVSSTDGTHRLTAIDQATGAIRWTYRAD